MDTFVQHGDVTCEWSARDQYNRLLGVCVSYDGTQLNAVMVVNGFAWAYMSDLYRWAEASARAGQAGVWAAPNQTAAEYRRATDAAILANQPRPPDPNCSIKGNINAAGDRIYHLPGESGYAETVIRVDEGERWFCTVDEALAAGWRARR